MENSAFEALIIGVNLSIFVIATTIAITLFSTVLDLSEVANNTIQNKSSGSAIIESKEASERIITGSELISYYTNNVKNSNAMQNEKDTLYVYYTPATNISLEEYLTSLPHGIDNAFIKKKFSVSLKYVDTTGAEQYVFKEI